MHCIFIYIHSFSPLFSSFYYSINSLVFISSFSQYLKEVLLFVTNKHAIGTYIYTCICTLFFISLFVHFFLSVPLFVHFFFSFHFPHSIRKRLSTAIYVLLTVCNLENRMRPTRNILLLLCSGSLAMPLTFKIKKKERKKKNNKMSSSQMFVNELIFTSVQL